MGRTSHTRPRGRERLARSARRGVPSHLRQLRVRPIAGRSRARRPTRRDTEPARLAGRLLRTVAPRVARGRGGSGRTSERLNGPPRRNRPRANPLSSSLRALSSVGRAPARQAGGHWFEPSSAHSRKPRSGGVFVAQVQTGCGEMGDSPGFPQVCSSGRPLCVSVGQRREEAPCGVTPRFM